MFEWITFLTLMAAANAFNVTGWALDLVNVVRVVFFFQVFIAIIGAGTALVTERQTQMAEARPMLA